MHPPTSHMPKQKTDKVSSGRRIKNKKVPGHMGHMTGNLSTWGQRWIPEGVEPSQGGYATGSFPVDGAYPPSGTPLSGPQPSNSISAELIDRSSANEISHTSPSSTVPSTFVTTPNPGGLLTGPPVLQPRVVPSSAPRHENPFCPSAPDPLQHTPIYPASVGWPTNASLIPHSLPSGATSTPNPDNFSSPATPYQFVFPLPGAGGEVSAQWSPGGLSASSFDSQSLGPSPYLAPASLPPTSHQLPHSTTPSSLLNTASGSASHLTHPSTPQYTNPYGSFPHPFPYSPSAPTNTSWDPHTVCNSNYPYTSYSSNGQTIRPGSSPRVFDVQSPGSMPQSIPANPLLYGSPGYGLPPSSPSYSVNSNAKSKPHN